MGDSSIYPFPSEWLFLERKCRGHFLDLANCLMIYWGPASNVDQEPTLLVDLFVHSRILMNSSKPVFNGKDLVGKIFLVLSHISLICNLSAVVPNSKHPTQTPHKICVFLCFCNWVDFSSLSDRSTYQYNYSDVNHVERKRQRLNLFAFFFKGILYTVLFMVFLYYKVKLGVHHYHVIGLSLVCFLIVCSPSCHWSQEYLIGLLTRLSIHLLCSLRKGCQIQWKVVNRKMLQSQYFLPNEATDMFVH